MAGKLTPQIALEQYAALGDNRNILQLEKALREQGYACSRTTLHKWHDQNGWAEIAPRMVGQSIVEEAGKSLVKFSENVGRVDGFERVLYGLEGMSEDIITRVRELLPTVVVENVKDLVDLAKLASHTATAVSNIRKGHLDAASAVKGDTTNIQNNFVAADPEVIAAFERASGITCR